MQNEPHKYHVKPKVLTVLETLRSTGALLVPMATINSVTPFNWNFYMENCSFKLTVVECWWNCIIASRLILSVNYQHIFFKSLLKNKKKSAKVYIEDTGVIGKISEEPDFGGIYKIKYGALKTENIFKTNAENLTFLQLKVIWLHMCGKFAFKRT